jgi:hypothetical protein
VHRSRAAVLGIALVVAGAACANDVMREPFLDLDGYAGVIAELRVHCRDGNRFMVSQVYRERGCIDCEFVAGVLLDLPADSPRRIVVRGTQPSRSCRRPLRSGASRRATGRSPGPRSAP